jgi:hypothetical protein
MGHSRKDKTEHPPLLASFSRQCVVAIEQLPLLRNGVANAPLRTLAKITGTRRTGCDRCR